MSDIPLSLLYNPVFPDDWQRSLLYDCATWTNGLAFRDVHFSNRGKPVIKIAEIKNGITDQTGLTEQEFAPDIAISQGDMLFSWSGSPETSIDVSWWRGSDGWLNQHIFKVEPNTANDSVFFYYILKYLKPLFIRIAKNKQTTGLGHVTIKDLKAMTVAAPSLPEQRAIAHVLGALDDKIELNRRMNVTLEEMARTLFRSWFVDFEPFNGVMPSDWTVSTIGDQVEFTYGKPLKENQRSGGDIPVYGSNGCIGWHDEALVKGPGIIVGRKGNPGTVVWSPLDFYPIDTTFYITPKAGWANLYYLYYALSVQDLPSLNSDSAVPGLNRNFAYMNTMVIPSRDILFDFEVQAKLVRDKIAHNEVETKTLVSMRDSLLPKLISGEVRLSQEVISQIDSALADCVE